MMKSTLFTVFCIFVSSVVCNKRLFINKCSIKDPKLEECFANNGNLAIQEISTQGVEDLEIPNLDGFDLGDLFFSLESDFSFLIEDGKSYPKGVKLERAHLKFDDNKNFIGVHLEFSLTDVHWEGKYRALGFLDGHKVQEKGDAIVKFGKFYGNYTGNFKRKQAEGMSFLKIGKHYGKVRYEKFEFLPQNARGTGRPLGPEQFQQLEKPLVDKAIDISLDYITFVFNQLFQEIPENEIFLP